MPIRSLVNYRSKLIDLANKLTDSDEVQRKLYDIDHFKQSMGDIEYNSLLDPCVGIYQQMFASNQQVLTTIDDIIKTIDVDITHTVSNEFSDSEYLRVFSEELMTQELTISQDLEAIICGRIAEHSLWQYPALQINPRKKLWVDSMVASDPLYLVSYKLDTIDSIIQEYPPQYQRRVRVYRSSNRDHSRLPQGQFGFILCWDNFNYLSLDKVKIYIKQAYNLLRPGGVLMFSYNNCDLEGGAMRADARASSYASARLLTQLVTDMGYEILCSENYTTDDAFDPYVSWFEIRKPGELRTIKQHQAMAEIIEK